MKQTGIGFVELEELAAALDVLTGAVAFVGLREHAIANGDNKSARRESIAQRAYTARKARAGIARIFWIGLPDELATR